MKKNVNFICTIVAICMVLIVVCFTFFNNNDTEQSKRSENKIIISFGKDDEIIQSFFGTMDNICKMGIEFSPQLREIGINITVYDNEGEVYFHESNLKVRDKTIIELDKTIENALGHEYYLKMQSLDNVVSCFATRGEYPDNHLLVNGLEQTEDIILEQYSRETDK